MTIMSKNTDAANAQPFRSFARTCTVVHDKAGMRNRNMLSADVGVVDRSPEISD